MSTNVWSPTSSKGGGAPSGAAGGDLDGTYPDPSVVALQGNAVAATAPNDADVLTWVDANSDWEPAPGGGGGGVISKATVKLTNAQVLALPTTPVELVAAPGAGKVLVPSLCVFYLAWTADYTNIDMNCVLGLIFGGASYINSMMTTLNETSGSKVSYLLAEGDSNYAQLGPAGTSQVAGGSLFGQSGNDDNTPGLTNQALQVTVINGAAGDFTGGDPANTLQVSVYYDTLTLI